jgi:hypothetical protein
MKKLFLITIFISLLGNTIISNTKGDDKDKNKSKKVEKACAGQKKDCSKIEKSCCKKKIKNGK